MGRKIFVSYKYKDRDVKQLPDVESFTGVHDYVDKIAEKILDDDDIYKGEKSDEDLSSLTDEQIGEHLKEKIYDSTITIVLISPNMRDGSRLQKYQGIPQEIRYSLYETSRSDRTSHNNAILAVVLPNANGSYSYYDKDDLFDILSKNIDNGYIYLTEGDDFIKYPNYSIGQAEGCRENTPPDKIVKTI